MASCERLSALGGHGVTTAASAPSPAELSDRNASDISNCRRGKMPLEYIKIDDLDADALLERTDQDEGLARTILLSFAESQRDSAAPLPELLATDPAAAGRRVHDLKSTLGNIGATRLYQDAISLSERLRPHLCDAGDQNRHDNGTLQLAEALQAGVARLCADIEAALHQPSRRHSRPVEPAEVRERLAALARFLEAGRARDAQRLVAELAGTALETADRALLDRVAPLVRRYRLRDALILLSDDRNV